MSSHWDRVGASYDQEWRPPAKQVLSRAELDFVTRHLARSPGGRVLDVGVGSGRILGALLAAPGVERVVGMDASPEMAEVCRGRFAADQRLEAVHVRDIAADGPPDGSYGFVSAIRVLKYEASWRELVGRLVATLAPGGVLVFTMPNRRSLNAISRRYDVPWHTASRAELLGLTVDLGVDVLELTAFTKLPFFLYSRASGRRVAKVPVALDRALAGVLGGQLLGRELFVAVAAPA